MDQSAVLSSKQKVTLCPWCLNPSQVIWVHGHGQCGYCGINVQPCCDGQCETGLEQQKMPVDSQDN